MTSQQAKNHEPPRGYEGAEPSGTHRKGASRIRWSEVARRVRNGLSGLPSSVADQMKRAPYRTILVAAVAGVGIGVLLGSRVLRTILVSSLSYAVVEITRVYIRDRLTDHDDTPMIRT
jgi:hypothetical protein